MKNKKYYSPMPKMMWTTFALTLVGCAFFVFLYHQLGIGWILSVAITFGMIAYHITIRFLSPVILWMINRKKYNYQSKWFRQKKWEPGLYQWLREKHWKKHIMAYDPSEFSMEIHSLEEIVNNMCHAESVHELIVVLSFTSLLFAIPFGAFGVFVVTAVLVAMLDMVFVILQRYNRPRVVALMNKQRNKEVSGQYNK